MSTGKKIRLGKILKNRRAIIVPIDHGLTLGPLPGLESSLRVGHWLGSEIDAIIAHKGMVARLAERDLLKGCGVIVHLNGMNTLASDADSKEMLTTVAAAARLGADAVSLQVNFTGENDRSNWQMLGQVSDEAESLGLPVLTMIYDKVKSADANAAVNRLRQLMRVAVELGTDAIKIGMPANLADLARILDPVQEDTLVFLAGGELSDSTLLLQRVRDAIHLGVSGVCMGRNIFSSPNPEALLKRLSRVVHKSAIAEPGANQR